ncbi:MAG: DUF262 domain-containing protein [Gordonia sp. (in: high G+C Gram-positive bacteria)]|uniref:GmrSD restriction endonuclease domain-containing protein n=1 Tax=Gordonia sp. (in: high G+C Gram-positive bacteria) TaxID=84139 RepID=UPI0039E4910E
MSGSLSAPLKAEVFDVEELVAKAWQGEVRIPAFQRPLRWGFEDACRLIDSILRGYPIGNLLMWSRAADAGTVRLGALSIDAPALGSALWVVDGQQRVTTLANVFSPEGSKDSRFGLSVDLTDERVVRTKESAPSHVIPLPVLFDLQELMRWFRDRPEAEEYFDRATGVSKRILKAQISASVVTTGDEDVLREIFDRVNNYGKRLKRSEVFAALHPAEPSDDDWSSFASIAESIDAAENFGLIDVDTVMKAVLARRGADITRDIRLEFTERRGTSDFPDEDVKTAYRLGAESLTAAVNFLQQEAGVPHMAFLPYKYLLIVLSRVFGHHDLSEPSRRRLLKRWFWRAATAGPSVFLGSATGAARALCTRVVPDDADKTLLGLLDAVPEDRLVTPDVCQFRTNHATGKIIACAMWALEPRSLVSGTVLTGVDLSAALDEVQTPRDALLSVVGRGRLPNDVANEVGRWLLLPDTDISAVEVEDRLVTGDLDGRVLASHAISETSLAKLADTDVIGFVRERSRDLQVIVDDFLRVRWEQGFESRSALSAYVFDDPEDDADEAPAVG